MKKKTTATKKKSVWNGPVCTYCGAPLHSCKEICGNCHKKKDSVHKLWLIGQKILADAGRLNNNETED